MDATVTGGGLSPWSFMLLFVLGAPLTFAAGWAARLLGDIAAHRIERRFALPRPKSGEDRGAPILSILLMAAFMASFLTVVSMGDRTFGRMLGHGLAPFALAVLLGWPASLPAAVLWTVALVGPGLVFVALAYVMIGA